MKCREKICIFLILSIVCSLIFSGCAELPTEETIPGLEFQLNEDGKSYTVGGDGDGLIVDAVIPDKYNGLPVTTIVGFRHCDFLQSVTIPESVTNIHGAAFQGCASLESINIPSSVTEIDDFTFVGCPKLKSIVIPNSVTRIGHSAFMECTAIENVTIGSGVVETGNGSFAGCTSLKNVTLSEGLTFIGKEFFSYCTSLSEITIPSSVTVIEEWAFAGCTSLKKIIYDGTKQEWEAIEKKEGWNEFANTVVCSDGELSLQK